MMICRVAVTVNIAKNRMDNIQYLTLSATIKEIQLRLQYYSFSGGNQSAQFTTH